MAELRIGNAERERASHLLGDHYASGRLDDEEYAERLDAVWSARTGADLDLVFHDLPRPVVPRQPVRAARPTPRPRRPRVGVPLALLVAGLVMLTVVTNAPWWLLAAGVVALFMTRGGACR